MSIQVVEVEVNATTNVIEVTVQGPQGVKGDQGDAGQGVPAGGTTGQVLAKVDNTDYNTHWITISGGGGAVAWGDITGTLSDQTDLQSALDSKAASSHAHSASDITSGTMADARIAESNVTQHQSAISITESQISDLAHFGGSVNDLSDVSNVTPADKHVLIYDGVTDNRYENRLLVEADISDLGSYAPLSHTHAASDITSGTLADARVSQTSVTQHQGALSITESQISDLQSYTLPGDDADTLGSGAATNGQVLTADGIGGAAWATPGSGVTDHGLLTGLADDDHAQYHTDARGDARYSQLGHVHDASDINSGTFADARIAQTNVTQHQAALSITESQISDLGSYITGVAWGDVTGTLSSQVDLQSALDGKAASSHAHATSDITSGTFADARISESSVTQHQAALSITESQISDLAHTFAPTYFIGQTTDTTERSGTSWEATWNTELKKDSDFTHAANSAVITCNFTGEVLISANTGATLGAVGTFRVILDVEILINGTPLARSQVSDYVIRTNNQPHGSVSISDLYVSVSTNDTIQLRTTYNDPNGSNNITVNPNMTRIAVKRIS